MILHKKLLIIYTYVYRGIRMDTLHVKIDHGINNELKKLAKARSSTVSELIRQALVSCYQVDLLGLPDKQRQALEKYQLQYGQSRRKFQSISKLSNARR